MTIEGNLISELTCSVQASAVTVLLYAVYMHGFIDNTLLFGSKANDTLSVGHCSQLRR